MTRNFSNCPRCGKQMEIFSHRLPLAKWNGQTVCLRCERELVSQNQDEKPRFINGIGD